MEPISKGLNASLASMPISLAQQTVRCPQCGTNRSACECGQEAKRKKEADDKRYAEERRKRKIDGYFDECEIPLRYVQSNLNDFAGKQGGLAQEALNAVDVGQGSGLLIWGDIGSGKTHLACAILNALIQTCVDGLFVTVPDLLDAIRRDYDRKDGEKENLLEKAKEVSVLLLDDLAAEKPTDWVREKLYQLINARYNDCLVTLATTNLDPEELAERIGDRIVSRIVGSCKVIRLVGDDRRLANGPVPHLMPAKLISEAVRPLESQDFQEYLAREQGKR